jgi:5-formyltetrahydrofolate cyclo-ligase
MERDGLRREVLAHRDALGLERRRELAAMALQQALALPEWQAARTLLIHAAFRSEMETRGLMAAALEQEKRVCVPQCQVEGLLIIPRRIQGLMDLKPGAYGIPEPDAGACPAVAPEELDLVLVPGAVFDRRGHRLGYGAGYYDRFLPRCSRALSLGFGFSLQLIERLPELPHDVRVQALVTEKGALRFPL